MAIGASRADVARMVLADSLKLIAWGSAFGLLAAFFVTKPLAMFLVPGVKPGDPSSYAAVAAVFLLVGVLAAWGPSRQAAAIDPAANLRS
jgi:ABC-type antimicrobial peptide transport system permease subunit